MSTTLDRDETGSLIGSDKVDGTAVYGSDGNRIGSVERIMIDKLSGKVAYAVISYGGFLGIGDDYYPTPWSSLKYDTSLGGYRINVTSDQLGEAPRYRNESDWRWTRENDQRVYSYYKATPFWE
jgi:PRC-barrel domain